MPSAAITMEREYQDLAGSYQLPKDGEEHDRLDSQSASIIALMDYKAFHAPVRHPKRILDVGCGTGVMTNLLAAVYPDAQVIGVDIAAVPESRHGKRPNVKFVQGDIRQLVGLDNRFQLGSFDYVFQRLLVFGMTDWQTHIASIATLLKPGGWLESQEASMLLYSHDNRCVSDDWWWYSPFLADSKKLGIDVEISGKLREIFSATGSFGDILESIYNFGPKAREEAPQLAGLEGEILSLFSLVVKKTSGQNRSEDFVERLIHDMEAVWQRGFKETDKLRMHVIVGQKT